ncbi:MAG TPA: DUF952 domain-containing protein [Nocardioidaceae bacterium]|nr:DUF952 domain-containing protein [Nocardioidaceae bacterium]
MRIFHVALPADWEDAQRSGSYTMSTRGVTLEQEGFIHCSWEDQVDATRSAFYADVDELLLLTIDTDLLTSPWQVDEVPGGETFPHIYGALNLEAVVSADPFHPQGP